MRRIQVPMTDPVRRALVNLAESEYRDPREQAAVLIAELAHPTPSPSPSVDSLSQTAELLAAIEAACSGERGAAEALATAAKLAKARPFAGDRLRDEVLALARTLARTPAEELLPGGAAYMPLTMLRAALDAVLPAD